MATKRQLARNIESYVTENLARLGFERKGLISTVSIGRDFKGSVALNIASHRSDGLIGVSPVMRLEYAPIAKALNSLHGGIAGDQQPSLTTLLGYVMPERKFLEWLFDPTEDLLQPHVIIRMCAAIERYGIPFLSENASLERIVECLEQSIFSFKERSVYHIPVAYRLQGEPEKARKYVVARLSELDGRDDLACREYQSFARNFLDDLGDS